MCALWKILEDFGRSASPCLWLTNCSSLCFRLNQHQRTPLWWDTSRDAVTDVVWHLYISHWSTSRHCILNLFIWSPFQLVFIEFFCFTRFQQNPLKGSSVTSSVYSWKADSEFVSMYLWTFLFKLKSSLFQQGLFLSCSDASKGFFFPEEWGKNNKCWPC